MTRSNAITRWIVCFGTATFLWTGCTSPLLRQQSPETILEGDASSNTELISQQRLLTFLDDYFITYPIFVSKPGEPSELGLTPGLPTTFMVSPQGEVVARQVGPVTREMLEQFIQNWKPKPAGEG